MEQILYIPSFDEMLMEYADYRDLQNFYQKYGCAGLEIIRCEDGEREKKGAESKWIMPEMIRGVHMIFYSAWLDFWKQNEGALLREYGGRETWERFYRCSEPAGLLAQFQEDLDYASQVGAQYVVFHVSEVTIAGVFTHQYEYQDAEVIDETVKLINQLLCGKDYTFDFLMENLWWPGLTMTDPAMTKRLLDGVHYKKKGIMLDLGHLMCSNMELSTEEEAIGYIHQMLDEHEVVKTEEGRPLTEYIKGVHMHQSVTGAFAKQALREVQENGLKLADDYFQRFAQCYGLLGHIDTHRPFSSPSVRALIQRIAPAYVVHELMAKNREERDRMLAQQSSLLL